MTPQLQLAIKLLQLNRLELNDMVTQQMLENPLLEERQESAEPEAPPPSAVDKPSQGPDQRQEPTIPEPPAHGDTAAAADGGGLDIPWEAMAESYAYQPPGSNVRQGNDEMPGYDQTLTRSETLQEHLMWQLQLADLNELEREIGARIIGDVDELGYLKRGVQKKLTKKEREEGMAEPAPPRPAPQVIAEELEMPIEWVENVRHRIMKFDPVGVASVDLRECLLFQLDVLGYDEDDMVFLMVRDFLKEIEHRNYKTIAKKLKTSMEEIGEALKIITQLEPKPGRSFSSNGAPETQYITPDIYVVKVGEEYTITLNEDGLPKLRISRFYRNQLKEARSRGETKTYIRDKLRSATWLIRSIHQRQRTIYKVMDSILKYQQEFFDKGVTQLKPMVLQDVARDIGMHESTISRVTSNKYVHTPQGIFELKYFFNSSIKGTDGEDIASESVKNHIKQIISEEDPKRPHSDAQIVKLLKVRKIEIARRTVAKYREMMGILPSSKRKQIF